MTLCVAKEWTILIINICLMRSYLQWVTSEGLVSFGWACKERNCPAEPCSAGGELLWWGRVSPSRAVPGQNRDTGGSEQTFTEAHQSIQS